MGVQIQSLSSSLPQAVSALSNDIALAQSRLGQIFRMLEKQDEASPLIQIDEREVRRIIKWRTRRADFFDPQLFADPAWDMLLELYATHLAQQRIAISNICIAAQVPPTTALRWLATLEKRTLVCRKGDPRDARRVFVELTALGLASIESFFAQGAPRMAM